MLQILPYQFFSFGPFSTAIEVVSKFLPQKKLRSKLPPNTKSLACGFTFTRQLGFYTITCDERIFYVVSQEANKHTFYYTLHSELANNVSCKKRQWRDFIFHVLSQQATTTNVSLRHIAKSDNGDCIFYVVLPWPSGNDTIFTSYCKWASNVYVVLQESKLVYILSPGWTKTTLIYREDARSSCDNMPMMAHHATIKFSYAVECKKWQHQEHIFHRIARMWATSRYHDILLLIVRRTTMSMFFMPYRDERATTTKFFYNLLQGCKQGWDTVARVWRW